MHPIVISNSEILGYTLRIERISSAQVKTNNLKSQISDRGRHATNNHFVIRYDIDNNIFQGESRADGANDHLNNSYSVNYQSEVNRSMMMKQDKGEEAEDQAEMNLNEIKV